MTEYNELTKTLIIYHHYEYKKIGNIPEDTKIIIFDEDSYFNEKVDNLPLSLTHLTFGYSFNKPVDNLPKKLTHLTFGVSFNKSVDYLPKKLTHLTFGWYFNQKVDNLPKKLTHLTFGECFNQKVDNLPESLISINFGWKFKNIFSIPKNVKSLSLACNNFLINNLPEHIEKLFIVFSLYKPYKGCQVINLPLSLKEIIIESDIHKKYLTKIPFGTIITVNKYKKIENNNY
jgi:hypothetical protein